MPITDIVGYAASAVIITSLTMTSVVKLRVIGLAGAASFSVYGLLIGAVPVMITNVIIMGIHAFYLREMLGAKDYFTLLEVQESSAYLRYFIEFHRDDISRRLPAFALRSSPTHLRIFILRNAVPAGLLIAECRPDGIMVVDLDYVIPEYRDFKNARYLFTPRSGALAGRQIDRVYSPPGTEAHQRYLRRMGFVETSSSEFSGYFELDVAGA
ncbi:MAG: hypothetical protein OEM81_14320 [Acidimicrobiia bacterium]|nr:hypothetical protein [Acidimicrobiia bacterium]MDH3398985.1 hypothetical protein [Acidimicrobiia bacterium]